MVAIAKVIDLIIAYTSVLITVANVFKKVKE